MRIFDKKLGINIPCDADEYQSVLPLSTEDYRFSIRRWLCEVRPFHLESAYPEYSDISIAKMFSEASSSFCAYFLNQDNGTGNWRIYNNGIWRLDSKGKQVERGINIFAEEVLKYIREDKELSNLVKTALELQTKPKRKRLLDDAESGFYLPTSLLDKDRYLFVCKNGVFDGQKMEFREHRPEDYSTKASKAIFNPTAKSEVFEKFIDETFFENEELKDYVQRLAGSMLIGDRIPQEFYVLYGETRSGKGTLIKAIDNVLDCYSEVTLADLFLSNKKPSSGHNESLASLADKRLIYMDEVDKGQSINCKLLKAMTGGTKIRASRKHEHEFTFQPQWHLVLMTNHHVEVDDDTVFESYRIVIIPFNNHHTFEEIDTELDKKLTSQEASSAILNWMIEGYSKFHSDGFKLSRPQCIIEAIEEYRGNRNVVLQYVSERLEEDINGDEMAIEVYADFKTWCKEKEFIPKGKNQFYKDMRNIGVDVSEGVGNKMLVKSFKLKNKTVEKLD